MRAEKIAIAVVTTVFLVTLSSSATAVYGFCMAPRAPALLTVKPNKPFCVYRKNCSSLEVQAYRDDISRYFDGLQQYLLDVDKFRKLAYEYAECEAKLD